MGSSARTPPRTQRPGSRVQDPRGPDPRGRLAARDGEAASGGKGDRDVPPALSRSPVPACATDARRRRRRLARTFYRVEDVKRSLDCPRARAIAELEMRLDVVSACLEAEHVRVSKALVVSARELAKREMAWKRSEPTTAEGGAVVDQKQPSTVMRNVG